MRPRVQPIQNISVQHSKQIHESTHLNAPPPFTCIHLGIHADRHITILVVTLGRQKELRCPLGVAKQGTNDGDDIAQVNLELNI